MKRRNGVLCAGKRGRLPDFLKNVFVLTEEKHSSDLISEECGVRLFVTHEISGTFPDNQFVIQDIPSVDQGFSGNQVQELFR